jgi:hypothetical protein
MLTRTSQGHAMDVGEQSPDDVIIHQLGAAVLLCWNKLPLLVRGQILSQADWLFRPLGKGCSFDRRGRRQCNKAVV